MNPNLWYCSNIVVATLLCLNISFLSATGAPITIPGLDLERERQKGFIDKAFALVSVVNGRNVTCSGTIQGSHYPFPMYTCQNISVSGEKLYHGYSTDGSRRNQQCASECPCGNNNGRASDTHALCAALLKANNVTEPLIAAYIIKPHCSLKERIAKRVKFYIDEKGKQFWEDLKSPNGYINMLQCLTEKYGTKS